MANRDDMREYLYRMLVPPGFRPQSDEEIEKALDVFDDGPMDLDAVNRILGKSKGEIPFRDRAVGITSDSAEKGVESGDLLALHRSEGDVESEEIRKKLEKYRQQAKDEIDIDDESGDDVDGLED